MRFSEFQVRSRAIGFAGLLAACCAVGCNDSKPTPAPSPSGPGVPGGPGMASPSMGGPEMMGGAPQGPDDYTGEFPEGRQVFRSNCSRCHSVGGAAMAGVAAAGGPPGAGPPIGAPAGPPSAGPGGPPGGGPGGPMGGMRMGRGPDLAKVGADPNHSKDWLEAYIRNPKSKKEDSRMPGFEGKLSQDDLTKLIDYLASLQ